MSGGGILRREDDAQVRAESDVEMVEDDHGLGRVRAIGVGERGGG